MRYMNADQHFKVVSVSALCMWHYLNDSARLGWAMRKAVEDHYDGTVAFLASGSLSHRFAQNGTGAGVRVQDLESVPRSSWTTTVVELWKRGDWKTFCAMLPEYASKGHGEGFMHDTAMLLGVLGWSAYDGRRRGRDAVLRRSGTGQINAVFPVTPQDGHAVPKAVASSADGYSTVATRL